MVLEEVNTECEEKMKRKVATLNIEQYYHKIESETLTVMQSFGL